MNINKSAIKIILLSGLWISASEFVRNQLLFLSYWTEHYRKLGIEFNTKPINGMVWGVWSFVFAWVIYTVSTKFSFKQALILSWMLGFVLMWLVIGNLGVLPLKLLIPAVPLSLLEIYIALLIRKKLTK